jgi:DNA-binding response OmpR family regulator
MSTLSRQSDNRAGASPSRRRKANVKPHVLVVEDHDDTRLLLVTLLELRSYRVSVAADGEDAVRVAERERPGLILMDASLPRLDGLEATRRIRAHASLHDVPVVFLSGHAEASFRAVALETGGNEYLVKPFEVDQLDAVLRRHLGKNAAVKAD